MNSIETVRGPLPADELGVVLMHEHVFILTPELDADYPQVVGWDEEAKIADAVLKLKAAKAAGVNTIVDLTVVPMGRDVRRIRRVSEASGVNIVAASGLYTFDALPKFLEHFGPGARFERPEPMIEMFIKDVTDGIGTSGVKAGIYKCVTDTLGLTPGVERVLRAVAQAHLATGVPISTHTDAATKRGLDQQDVFTQEGVDLTRVIIGHSGDSTDIDYLRTMADRGSYLGMDRFGMYVGPVSFDDRVNTVVRMCELGYADRMVLSHDTSCWMDWLPHDLTTSEEYDRPEWHYCHISNDVIPALRERGVSAEQIDLMLVRNPAKVLGMSPGST